MFHTAVQIQLSQTDLPLTRCIERDIDFQLQSTHLKINTLASGKRVSSLFMKGTQTRIHPNRIEDSDPLHQSLPTSSISLP